VKPTTTEQEYEKYFFDAYTKARKKIGGGDPQLDAAYDPIFEALTAAFYRVINGHGLTLGWMAGEKPVKSGKATPAKTGKVVGRPAKGGAKKKAASKPLTVSLSGPPQFKAGLEAI